MSGDPITPTAAALQVLLDTPTIAALVDDRIYYPDAPDGRAWPYLLLDCIDAPEAAGTFTGPISTSQVWAVRVVTAEDVELAGQIAGAVNLILEGAELAIAGYRNLCCYRRRAIPPRPVKGDDGVVRYHGGGEYNIEVGEPA